MNKILIAILTFWLVGIVTAKAQLIVRGIDVNSLDIQYIELIGFNRSSSQASVWIDFGQNYDASKANEFLKPINDHEGERFTSVVEALNYIYKNGWELVTTYTPAPTATHHYVLRRRTQAVK